MAEEDQSQNQRCTNSNSSSGVGIGNNIGRSSRKQRPKKVPQRGLGVAQLEKIRIEELQKKDASAAANLPSPPTVCQNSSYLSLPIPSFNPSNKSCSSSSVADLSPPSSMFRPPFSTGNTVPFTSDSPGWPPGGGAVFGHNFWSSCEYSIEKDCSALDPGLVFSTNLSLPYESEPIWPLPSLMHRAQPFQPSTSMVEPPSNQSYYGNCTHLLPEEEKVLGMKRSYPFSLDNAPSPPIYSKYPPIVHSISGQFEAASSSNGSTFNSEPRTPNFRERPSCSTSNFESKSKKSINQNEAFDGHFLTLAPPTTTSTSSSSKFKHPPSNLINCELTSINSLSYQASFEDSTLQQGNTGSGSNKYRPYYSFFPPAMVQIDRATTLTMANCNGEVGHVDLNLKL